jgi:predicted Rossmann-fold nucleotide-binding protein
MPTLLQTRRVPPAPVVLFGEAYWRCVLNFEALVEEDMISAADLTLFDFADTAEGAWQQHLCRGLRAHDSR